MVLTRYVQHENDVRTYLDSKFFLAADLGQSNDPTAIAIIEHTKEREVTVKGVERAIGEKFDVRHLARLPLGLSYVAQTQEIAGLLGRPPLSSSCELIVDDTGVGRAVSEIILSAGLKPTRVTITGGDQQSQKSRDRWHVPKQMLVSALDARLHTGELRFAADLAEAKAMQEELKEFRRSVSAAGRYSYDAREGKHDDLVLAVALGIWGAVGRPRVIAPYVGTYRFTP